jgi:hypothetical protein
MSTTPRATGRREWVGRMALTLTIGCGALATMFCVSDALTASERIDRIDTAIAGLSAFVENSHATLRARIAGGESLDDAIAAFDAGMDRRLSMVQATLKQGAAVAWWTSPVIARLDLRRIAEDRGDYVVAAETAAAADSDRHVMLRRFDLFAQKLIVTMDAARDAVEPSRTAALGDAHAMVMLALGIGGLVIAYLVWLPVFDGRGLHPPRAHGGPSPLRRIAALF